MKKFIINYLKDLIYDTDVKFQSPGYNYGSDDSVVKIFGQIHKGIANLSITRCRKDGTAISSIPAFGMPLTKTTIKTLAELAEEAL